MSDDMNFADYVTQERARLTEARNSLTDQRFQIDQALANIDREFAAVAAYETAKAGKASRQSANTAAVPKARRVRRSDRREAILREVAKFPVSRGDLLTSLGVKGDKAGENAISNALTSLVKRGQLVRDNGTYRLPNHENAAQEGEIYDHTESGLQEVA